MAKKQKSKKKNTKRKRIISTILILIVIIIGSVFYYISNNFSKILTEKIHNIYSQTQIANYYKLDFKTLRINLMGMKVRIYDIHLEPIDSLNSDYFEKHGSLEININKIVLNGADIMAFISSDQISIDDFIIKESNIILDNPSGDYQPFAFLHKEDKNDSLVLEIQINNLSLTNAKLSYYGDENKDIINSFQKFNLDVSQLSYSKVMNQFEFSLTQLKANLEEAKFKSNKGTQFGLDKLQFSLSALSADKQEGDIEFDYKDFIIQLFKPHLTTADSVYSISTDNVTIDESKKLLSITNAHIKPILNKQEFANKYKYQKLRPEVKANNIRLTDIDFRKLIDGKGIFADTLFIEGAVADLYKDKRVKINKNNFPNYLAKQIFSIKIPIEIKVLKASGAEVKFSARQEDGQLSYIEINKLDAKLTNIQNKDLNQKLGLYATATVHNSIPFSINIFFNYNMDHFTFQGKVFKSNLANISSVVRSFAPVLIKSGEIKHMSFNGFASRTYSKGEMTFEYDNLNIELDLKDKEHEKKKKFRSHILSFAANTVVYSNNPVNPGLPLRIVEFHAQRDMNKGFINILLKSIFSGVKENLLPSQENRKKYKKEKKGK